MRRWIAKKHSWIEVVESGHRTHDPALLRLDDGERAAIELAVQIGAELILMDDRDGVIVARDKGFAVTGTLGVLDLAARRDLIRLEDAFKAQKATSFRCRPEIMTELLARHAAERDEKR